MPAGLEEEGASHEGAPEDAAESEDVPGLRRRATEKPAAAAASRRPGAADDDAEQENRAEPARTAKGKAASSAAAAPPAKRSNADADEIPAGRLDSRGLGEGAADDSSGDGHSDGGDGEPDDEETGFAVVLEVLANAKAEGKAKASAKAAARKQAMAAAQAAAETAVDAAAEAAAGAGAPDKSGDDGALAKALPKAAPNAKAKAAVQAAAKGAAEAAAGDAAAAKQAQTAAKAKAKARPPAEDAEDAEAAAALRRTRDKRKSAGLGAEPAATQEPRRNSFAVDQTLYDRGGDVGAALALSKAAEQEDDFDCDFGAGMTAKEKAKLRRSFAAALRTKAAEECGMAAAADAVCLLPKSQKRIAKTALAKTWHLHGCAKGQYEIAQGLIQSKASKWQTTLAPRCVMIGLCGGPASFAEGLASGDLEEVRLPDSGQLLYKSVVYTDTDATQSWKRTRAGNPEAQAVLDALVVAPAFQATGRSCLPSLSAASALPPPHFAVEDATAEAKLKLRLEQGRMFAEKNLRSTKQAVARLEAEAASAAQKHILAALRGALAQCEVAALGVAESCAKWAVCRMTAEDPPLVERLLANAKTHFDSLSDWSSAAEGVRPRKLI